MVRLCFVVWVLRVGVFCCVLIVLILLICGLLCIAVLVVLAWWLRGFGWLSGCLLLVWLRLLACGLSWVCRFADLLEAGAGGC